MSTPRSSFVPSVRRAAQIAGGALRHPVMIVALSLIAAAAIVYLLTLLFVAVFGLDLCWKGTPVDCSNWRIEIGGERRLFLFGAAAFFLFVAAVGSTRFPSPTARHYLFFIGSWSATGCVVISLDYAMGRGLEGVVGLPLFLFVFAWGAYRMARARCGG